MLQDFFYQFFGKIIKLLKTNYKNSFCLFWKKWINGNKLENGKIEFIAIFPFFCEQTKTVYSFPIEFMAQRTYEKKFVAAKNIAIFSQKLSKLCIIKSGQNETFDFMQNKRSFPAKMAIFLAATTFFSPVLWDMTSMGKL